MKKKPLVDPRYKLCQGCSQNWHLKSIYACEKCLLVFQITDIWKLMRQVLSDLHDMEMGIKERPMIERS